MPQVLRPDNIPSTFTITGALTAQMVASVSSPIRATIGGQQYTSTSNLSLNLATTGAGGLDTGSAAIGTYYLYLVVSGGALALVASLSTAPSGFSAYKQIERVILGTNSLSATAILSVIDETSYQIELAKSKHNYVINGNFDYWQRGTSFSTAGGNYSADRMRPTGSTSGTVAISRQSFTTGQTDVPNNPTYFHRWVQTGVVSTSMSLVQRVEGVKTLANNFATFSLWLRSNSGTPTITLSVGQSFGSGGSAGITVASKSVTLSSSWQKYEITLAVPSISGKTVSGGDDYLSVSIDWPTSGTWNVDTAQWMLNEGVVAAPFCLAGSDLEGELEKCRRYYEKSYPLESPPGNPASAGARACWNGASSGVTTRSFPLNGAGVFMVTKRATPALKLYSAGGTIDAIAGYSSGTTYTVSAVNAVTQVGFTYITTTVAPSTSEISQFQYTADAEL